MAFGRWWTQAIADGGGLRKTLDWVLAVSGAVAYQCVVLPVLSMSFAVASLFVLHGLWDVADPLHPTVRDVVALAGLALPLAVSYALAWWVFWRLLSAERRAIRWYAWRVAGALMPYVLAFWTFAPVTDDVRMEPTAPAEWYFRFACMVAGSLMFPVYHAFIYPYVCRQKPWKSRRFLVRMAVFAVACVVVWVAAWRAFPWVYGGVATQGP
ncbi:hypothetical protein [Alicyclobacillus macrosporangiidus]|uniref:hypothetical protein n=1 Tax=Alicyclobacillus macrosporangiidus TaxID=392015 RepID=UPI000495C4E6|nr:hypothetical protein [Alicyclobacillus macrosporangiidus]